jgi:hypothetical protein
MLGQSALDVVLNAGIPEGMGTEYLTAVHGLASQGRCGWDGAGCGEVDAVVGDLVWIQYGTAFRRARRKSAATRVVAR